jgi:uncharacterized protein (TIGR02246 family)
MIKEKKTVAGTTPIETVEELLSAINTGDISGALALYEKDGVFVAEPGNIARGTEQIKAALEGFAALKPTMTAKSNNTIEGGDIVINYCSWTLTGTDPEGNAVEMEGLSTDVLRRQADGIWLLVIDNPYGSAICG